MKINVLDHGWIELVESWGSDERIIEAARMSTDKGFLGWGPLDAECEKCKGDGDDGPFACPSCRGTGKKQGDEKLLRYLWENKHTTPFEVPGMTIKVMCPVVVVWQWVRHRTMTYNILSGRYSEMPSEDYIPAVERLLADGGNNKQAGSAKNSVPLSREAANAWIESLDEVFAAVEKCYQDGLRSGIPKELARLPLGFGRYTRMMVTANLWNWLRFLKLRMDGHAQSEIQQYANAVGSIVAEKFPRTWQLFVEKK